MWGTEMAERESECKRKRKGEQASAVFIADAVGGSSGTSDALTQKVVQVYFCAPQPRTATCIS